MIYTVMLPFRCCLYIQSNGFDRMLLRSYGKSNCSPYVVFETLGVRFLIFKPHC